MNEIKVPILTVWPALTEASYLLRKAPSAQAALLRFIESGAVQLTSIDLNDVPRMRELLWKYRDLPMDLADAALVRVAERETIRTIFTIDRRDFRIYRPLKIQRFDLIP